MEIGSWWGLKACSKENLPFSHYVQYGRQPAALSYLTDEAS